MIIFIIFEIFLLGLTIFEGCKCIYINYVNPLPKFDNFEIKSDNKVKFIKTRKIRYFK